MFTKILKIFIESVLIVLMLCLLLWYDIVIYGIFQGKGQASIVWNSQPIEEVLKDQQFPDSLKQKLRLIKEIKQFAVDSLGINPSDNYTHFYDQHNKPALLTISACEPYSLKPKEWTFPFLGTVSYKGFFNKEKAQKEMLELQMHGYDIDVYSPSGWSTLGWFNDPVLSNMLKRSDGSLANLIIHELTHGTLYIKDNVTFNENLASFIGDKGAKKFLAYKFGIGSKQYVEYEQDKADEKIYNEYILREVDRLDSLYFSFSDKDNETFKKEKKNQLLKEIVSGVNDLPLHKKDKYFNYSLQIFYEKNAFCMAFKRYDSQQDFFEKEYREKFNSNLKDYLFSLKRKYPSL